MIAGETSCAYTDAVTRSHNTDNTALLSLVQQPGTH